MKNLITCLAVCLLSAAVFATTWTVDGSSNPAPTNLARTSDGLLTISATDDSPPRARPNTNVARGVAYRGGSTSGTSKLLVCEQCREEHGYSEAHWNNFTVALDSAFDTVDTVWSFDDLNQMLEYDAILLPARETDNDGWSLPQQEIDNISTFISQSGRALLFGENSNWQFWNNEILGIVGGSYSHQLTGYLSTVYAHELTAGVDEVSVLGAGVANGGQPLFSENVATLWGASENVLTVLDIHVNADHDWGVLDNALFAQNIATWLAGTPSGNTVWTVDDDAGADFYYIQDAVDAASDGDEILVYPGTYTSSQDGFVVNTLGKAVTLHSTDPDDPDTVAQTIIDGELTRRGIVCFMGETNSTVISGFTIANCFTSPYDFSGNGVITYDEVFGGGINCRYSSPTIMNCTIRDGLGYPDIWPNIPMNLDEFGTTHGGGVLPWSSGSACY